MTLVVRGASNGIQVLGDCSETEICDPCMAGSIDEDIWLDTGRYGINRTWNNHSLP